MTSRLGRTPIPCRIPHWCRGSLRLHRGSCSPVQNTWKPTILRKLMRTGFALAWRLRHSREAKEEFVGPLKPRLLSDDMIGLKEAAIAGLGIIALPGYVCRQDVQAGRLCRILPSWVADDTTITALIPYRQGLLPSVRVFLDHLATEFPKAVLM
jgi:DNA-binding transcriptional LysR family regulator